MTIPNQRRPETADVAAMREAERAVIADEGVTPKFKSEKPERDPNEIAEGRRLPEGFENPPCGTRGHRCIDFSGRYDPKGFVQLKIEKVREEQTDPQSFNCADNHYNVPLGVWVDAPISIVNILDDAVETTYEQQPVHDAISRGTFPTTKVNERRRFMYYVLESA